jgi:hypothetical protein
MSDTVFTIFLDDYFIAWYDESMEFQLSSEQLKVVSNFCNDLAKGVFLTVVINQIFSEAPPLFVFLSALWGIILTGILLYYATLFVKNL